MIGIESFRNYFKGFEKEYVIIGGTACDLLLSDKGLDFRSTKDIDMVLIIEVLSKKFAKTFWEYVSEAGYTYINKKSGEYEFYRFYGPKNLNYPKMIELFSRNQHWLTPKIKQHIAPIHIDDEISSLSAILLNEDYYTLLTKGTCIINDISILKAEYIIPFKAKAWLDLRQRKNQGEHIDQHNIKKHKNDIIRLSILLTPDTKIELPHIIKEDLSQFIQDFDKEELDLKQFGMRDMTKNDIIQLLCKIYGLPILQKI